MRSIASISDKKHLINRVALVIGGNLLFAVGINMIITPMNLYSSGFTGMSMLIRMFLLEVLHVPQIPGIDYLGIIYYLLNMPLFVLAYRALGKEFCVTTVISIGIASLCMSLVPVVSKPVFDDYLTACLVGGLVTGTGAGMVLKGGTSGGGQDIIGVALFFNINKARGFPTILLRLIIATFLPSKLIS